MYKSNNECGESKTTSPIYESAVREIFDSRQLSVILSTAKKECVEQDQRSMIPTEAGEKERMYEIVWWKDLTARPSPTPFSLTVEHFRLACWNVT